MSSGDNYVVTSSQGWCERLGNSIKSLGFGILLLLGGLVLLVWNEGHSVKTHKMYDRGLKIVVSLDFNQTQSIDPLQENKLIHVTGNCTTTQLIQDELFGVSPDPPALRLQRRVEMYQWDETKHSEEVKKYGGGTETRVTYTYDKEWSGSLQDSRFFAVKDGHQNPSSMLYHNADVTADPILLGAFELHSDITSDWDWWQPLDTTIDLNKIPNTTVPDDDPSWTVSRWDYGRGLYIGKGNERNPIVGDYRISFFVVPEQTISIVGRQVGNAITAFPSPTSSGGSILLVEPGIHSAAEMFQHANDNLTTLTWILRLVGFLCLFFSFQLLTEPLVIVADVLPFLGNIVGIVSTGLSAFVALMLALTVIALAWLSYRPMLSIPLLIVTVGATIVVTRQLHHNKRSREGYYPPPEMDV